MSRSTQDCIREIEAHLGPLYHALQTRNAMRSFRQPKQRATDLEVESHSNVCARSIAVMKLCDELVSMGAQNAVAYAEIGRVVELEPMEAIGLWEKLHPREH